MSEYEENFQSESITEKFELLLKKQFLKQQLEAETVGKPYQ